MTDETTISRELILAPSRSIARKKVGLVKRGLELAGEIVRQLTAEEYFERGEMKYIDFGDHQGAIEDFTKAIELDTEYVEAYNSRGELRMNLEELGDDQGAIEDFTKVIGLQPENLHAYRSRALAKRQLGDYKGAIEDYTKVLELDTGSNWHNAIFFRGITKSEFEDYQGAIEDLTKLRERETKGSWRYEGSLSCTGKAKYKLGDYYGAIEDFSKRIENKSSIDDLPFCYHWRGLAKSQLGDQLGGELDIKYAKELEDARAYYWNGRKKYRHRDYQGAIEELTKAIELAQTSPHGMFYYWRGMAKNKLGDQFGSENDITRARELDYDPDALWTRSTFEEDQRQ